MKKEVTNPQYTKVEIFNGKFKSKNVILRSQFHFLINCFRLSVNTKELCYKLSILVIMFVIAKKRNIC
jgi:hypothetical protein